MPPAPLLAFLVCPAGPPPVVPAPPPPLGVEAVTLGSRPAGVFLRAAPPPVLSAPAYPPPAVWSGLPWSAGVTSGGPIRGAGGGRGAVPGRR